MVEPLPADTLETLQRLGLTQYEARAYHALLLLGRADAGAVARAAALPPTRVHAVLRDLRDHGWVEDEIGRPVVYIPRPPRERMEARWADAQRAFEKAATDLDLAYKGRSHMASSPVWFVRGPDAIAQRFHELAASARQQVAVILPFLLSSDRRDFLPALLKSVRGGRRVRVLVRPEVDVRPGGEPWRSLLQAGVEFRRSPIPMRLTVADFETAVIMPPAASAERMVAIWNPLPEFVQLLRPAYELMWEQAEPIAATASKRKGRRA